MPLIINKYEKWSPSLKLNHRKWPGRKDGGNFIRCAHSPGCLFPSLVDSKNNRAGAKINFWALLCVGPSGLAAKQSSWVGPFQRGRLGDTEDLNLILSADPFHFCGRDLFGHYVTRVSLRNGAYNKCGEKFNGRGLRRHTGLTLKASDMFGEM